MNKRTLMLPVTLVATLAVSGSANAHFLWASFDTTGKKLIVDFKELPGADPLALGDRVKQITVWSSGSSKIALAADGLENLGAATTPFAAASLNYGVIDRRESGRGLFWLKYFAKAAATPKDSQHRFGLPVEVSINVGKDQREIVTVTKNGRPAPEAELVAENRGKVIFDGKVRSDGTLQLPAVTGSLGIRALVTDKTPGSEGGKGYDFIRSYSTLTVSVVAQSTMTVLSKSFGNFHDVIGETAFIETMMAKKLTKPQLEEHYRQRYLVHTDLDKILSAAKPVDKVPYGTDQKNVIPLLRQDMAALQEPEPKADAAFPETRAFLKELDASAKKGPYFALGVFHVYYGGITHGGRDIGEIIGETLNVPTHYYLESDGYDAYAKGINQITDPKARAEMVRGGHEAYVYLIKLSNNPMFKSQAGK